MPIKDFPRHRRLSECTDGTEVVYTTWEFSPDEQATLAGIFPRAAGVTHVAIRRHYTATDFPVEFIHLKPIAFDLGEVTVRIAKVTPVVSAGAEKLEAAPRGQLEAAIEQLNTALIAHTEPNAWATAAAPALASFRQTIASTAISLEARENGLLAELEDLAAAIAKDAPALSDARKWTLNPVPIFIYVEDYPELVGHQNIAKYLGRKAANSSQVTDADRNFEKMCKVADIDPQQLHKLFAADDHETRNQLTNRSGAVVTSELRRLWKDRQLKVRFSPDAAHLDTLISDPNSVYDVEINLDERSRGLKWFFFVLHRVFRGHQRWFR